MSALWQSLKYAETHNSLPLEIVKGEGCYVYDADGRGYINAFSGLSLPFGLGRSELINAVADQLATLPYLALNGVVPKVTEIYAERLASFVPGGPWHTLFSNSGSEAVDSALKVAHLYWIAKSGSKRSVLCFSHSYHGQTIAAMAVSGVYQNVRTSDLDDVLFTHSPVCQQCPFNTKPSICGYPCLNQAERLLAQGDVGTVLIEPIMAAGGVHVPPPGYWEVLSKLVKKYSALLIMDESATCAGRTGKKFAFQDLPVNPDMVLLAKGINGGYLPIGVLMMSTTISQILLKNNAVLFGPSQGGNAAICALGNAALDLFEHEKPWENAERQGTYLVQQLKLLQTSERIPMSISGQGLMVGIQFDANILIDNAIAEVIRDNMKSRGALVYGRGSFIGIFPPLVVEKETIDELIFIFKCSWLEFAAKWTKMQ